MKMMVNDASAKFSCPEMNRIRTLDGLRGIAILHVIAEHVGQKRCEYQAWAGPGSLGILSA
jgi:peptidoglycan/LPS O-acetylase OafA/YrhL